MYRAYNNQYPSPGDLHSPIRLPRTLPPSPSPSVQSLGSLSHYSPGPPPRLDRSTYSRTPPQLLPIRYSGLPIYISPWSVPIARNISTMDHTHSIGDSQHHHHHHHHPTSLQHQHQSHHHHHRHHQQQQQPHEFQPIYTPESLAEASPPSSSFAYPSYLLPPNMMIPGAGLVTSQPEDLTIPPPPPPPGSVLTSPGPSYWNTPGVTIYQQYPGAPPPVGSASAAGGTAAGMIAPALPIGSAPTYEPFPSLFEPAVAVVPSVQSWSSSSMPVPAVGPTAAAFYPTTLVSAESVHAAGLAAVAVSAIGMGFGPMPPVPLLPPAGPVVGVVPSRSVAAVSSAPPCRSIVAVRPFSGSKSVGAAAASTVPASSAAPRPKRARRGSAMAASAAAVGPASSAAGSAAVSPSTPLLDTDMDDDDDDIDDDYDDASAAAAHHPSPMSPDLASFQTPSLTSSTATSGSRARRTPAAVAAAAAAKRARNTDAARRSRQRRTHRLRELEVRVRELEDANRELRVRAAVAMAEQQGAQGKEREMKARVAFLEDKMLGRFAALPSASSSALPADPLQQQHHL
ncbi:hypothetical protein BC828DRAFT_404933 [Blastocladiella britannica]|nr:hypothetical protein BC828DRAFT_404933 [Blastocladiella britannica]